MAIYELSGEVTVSFTTEVEANSKEEAEQMWDAVYPGLPYIGDEWDETGDVTGLEANLKEDED